MKYCVDANVFITAWGVSYPRDIFSSLYREMENKFPGQIILIKPIFDEINHVSGKISKEKLKARHAVQHWIKKEMKISATNLKNDVERKALELMGKYETNDDSGGAGTNDIKLIAFASLNSYTVVTLEGKQDNIPGKKANYKIPLICDREGVECMDFIGLLRGCGVKC